MAVRTQVVRVIHRCDIVYGVESGHHIGPCVSIIHGGCDQIELAVRSLAILNMQCETRRLQSTFQRERDRYTSSTDCDDESWLKAKALFGASESSNRAGEKYI